MIAISSDLERSRKKKSDSQENEQPSSGEAINNGPLLHDSADFGLKGRISLELSQFLDIKPKNMLPELSLFLKFKASPKTIKLI